MHCSRFLLFSLTYIFRLPYLKKQLLKVNFKNYNEIVATIE